MGIRPLQPEDAQRWDDYVMRSDGASCYHLSGWQEVIGKSFGHRTWYLLSEDETKRISGVLPVVQLKSALFGNYAVSMPFFNYGGVVADTPHIAGDLIRAAIECAREAKAKHIELRHSQPFDNGLPVKTSKVSMRLDLPEAPEALWKSFPSKLRSQVQRPIKEGMYAALGREELLDDFYAIFAENMRDLGTPVYAKSFFRTVLKTFPGSTWICVVRTADRKAVAAGFLIGFKGMMEIPWASSLRGYNRLSPNMLLYWSVLSLACEKKYRCFDFGRSTPGEGTYRFKEQWGARPAQLYWHYWLENGGPMPELNPKNPKYRLAIAIWKRLPVGLTKMVGPAIVKNLP